MAQKPNFDFKLREIASVLDNYTPDGKPKPRQEPETGSRKAKKGSFFARLFKK